MYRCKNCYHGIDDKDLNSIFQCPVCGVERECFEEIKTDESFKGVPIAFDNVAIRRIESKCINCGRCAFVCEKEVGVKYNYDKQDPICLNCGACLQNCPMGAIVPNYEYKKVLEHLNDPEKIVIISISPAVRVALGEMFLMSKGSYVEKQLVACLRKLGFNYVLDTTFGADLTTVLETHELLERLNSKKNLPLFSSCCPSWVKYLEIYHPELIDNLSTCKSPIGMQGSIIKTYFAKKNNLNPANIIHVALTPCTSKKYEISNSYLNRSDDYNKIENLKDTDYVITTIELGLLLKEQNIDLNIEESSNFDNLLSKGSSAGLLFGHHTGVTTSILRALNYMINKETLDNINFKSVDDHLKELKIKIGNYNLKIAIVEGILNFEKMLDKLNDYDFVEVMNCIGGCIGGGGQPLNPISDKLDILASREKSLINGSKEDVLNNSLENPDIKKIFQEFLKGPTSSLTNELLHLNHQNLSYLLKD